MGGAIKITRTDLSAKDLRRVAKRTKDGARLSGDFLECCRYWLASTDHDLNLFYTVKV
jgi:hypothetical protein